MISKAGVEQLGRALRIELAPRRHRGGRLLRRRRDRDDPRHPRRRRTGPPSRELLPWPLNVRITAAEAARTIADGIARRAPRTIAPSGWEPYSLLRGVVNVALDSRLTRDQRVARLIRVLENPA